MSTPPSSFGKTATEQGSSQPSPGAAGSSESEATEQGSSQPSTGAAGSTRSEATTQGSEQPSSGPTGGGQSEIITPPDSAKPSAPDSLQAQAAGPPQPTPSGASANSRHGFDIAEEYGTAKKNLPPVWILAICIVAVAIIVAAYSLTHRAHPLSSGSIDDVVSVPVPAQNMVMVAINVSVENNADKASWIHTITVALDAGGQTYTDDASPAVDVQRYFQAFPDLKQHALQILTPETKLDPGSKVAGTVVVSFPVTADAFNARKSLMVTIAPYDEVPLVMKK
jgi:hypothetical protein